jgi:glycosyltransferase involved in cell wall biosynthesis
MRTLELFRILDRSLYVFEFCALSGRSGELDDQIAALGGTVHPMRLGIVFPWAFLRLLRQRRYDVVHSHVHFFSGVILVLAALAGVPRRIAHFRSTEDGKGHGPRRRARNMILRHLLKRSATDIVGVSRAALDIALGSAWPADPRCQVIYSGIAVENFRVTPDGANVRREFGLPSDATLVIHVGRLSAEKNHERLVRIFLRFAQLVPGARLLIVGKRDAAIEARMAAVSNQGHCGDRIVLAGIRKDIGRLLASSDLMLFPSLREGLPGAVVEAAAAGLPVLASDIPGIAELAGRLPGLRTISLSLSDDDWANYALTAYVERRRSPRLQPDFPADFDVASARARFERLYNATFEETGIAVNV